MSELYIPLHLRVVNTPHIVVFASNIYHLAIDSAFESDVLAEKYIREHTKMDRKNLIVRPMNIVSTPLTDLPPIAHISEELNRKKK